MANCLNCGEEIISLEGRRPKLYCDNKGKCKGEYFRKQKKEPKYVQYKTFAALLEKFTDAAKDSEIGKRAMEKAIKETKELKVNNIALPPRLEGENTIDYKIRISELNETTPKP